MLLLSGETNAINMSSYILKLVPPMKKSATFVLEDPAVASTSSSNYSGSASPLLPPPRIVDEAKLKKRRYIKLKLFFFVRVS